MNALINQCQKRGQGLSAESLELLKTNLQDNLIDEVEIKDGFSYFPKGKRRNARIAKIAFSSRNRVYLEFNYVNLESLSSIDEFNTKVWRLNDNDRIAYHARGVRYCYVGDNVTFALQLIDEAKRTKLV
ncbi:hypothetical protein V7112_22940 [Bacillus sp. JJ1566]|uniref:hypothetical protein n=1 Tax=Bacillus sp. JJ1566 TaxID=3122961 RepID=UPI00300069D6